jgi:amino acid adenylation domain-containing protein
MVGRSFELIYGIMAILKAGGAYVPIDNEYPPPRKSCMLKDSQVRLVLTNQNTQLLTGEGFEEIEKINIQNKGLYTGDSSSPKTMSSGSNLLYVIYTSGSTGIPKGVMLEHRNLVNLLRYQYKYTDIDFSSVLQFATISFDGSAQEIFSTLLAGGKLSLIDEDTRNNVPGLFKVVEKNEIKTIIFPTAFLKFLFKEKDYLELIPAGIRHLVVAGEQLIVSDTLKEYLKQNSVYLHNHYGPAETHVVTALTLDPKEEIPVIPSIGKPILNTGIFILDKGFHLMPIGVPGELYIGGIQVGRGYWGKEQLTRERFITNPFRQGSRLYKTGDLARWLADGTIEFLGRIDSQVKIRGFRVEIGEIESQLLKHEGVKEAAVVPRTARDGDIYLCAYIAAVDTSSLPSALDLRKYLSGRMPNYMVPSYFVALENIPLTPNGKLDRRSLPEPGKTRTETGKEFAAPRDEIERKLVERWEKELNIAPISIDDNFFDVGGHSLKVLKIINFIHKAFGVKVNFRDVYQSPTTASLATFIRKSAITRHTEIEKQPEKEYYELSYTQGRLWVIYKRDPGDPAFNMSDKVTFNEKVDEHIVKKVFEKLLARHESLRTFFKEVDNRPVQMIQPVSRLNLEIIDLSHLGAEVKEKSRQELFRKESEIPFNVEMAPLIRAKLIKCSENEYDLLLTIHHLIFDGWSREILEREFQLIYETCKKDKEGELQLEPLRIQYKDYAAWNNRLLADEEKMQAAKEFWKSQFSTDNGNKPPLLDLPYDFSKKNPESKESAGLRIVVPGEIIDGLRQLARENNASLFMVLLAGFNLFLSRLSGQKDIILAVPGAGRQHEDLKNIIGVFVNTLVLRNRVVPHESFIDFLAKVRKNTFRVLEYQSYPLELICSQLKIKYPDISVFFNMSLFGDKDLEYLENFDSCHYQSVQNAKFDMVCYLAEYKNGVDIETHYYKRLFKAENIEKFMQLYVKILGKIASDPGKKVSAYSMPEKRLKVKWNDGQNRIVAKALNS